VKLFIALIGAVVVAGGAWAQEPSAGPLDRTQQLGAWTVSDTGGKAGDDSEREVRLSRAIETVTFVLHRSNQDGAGMTLKFSRCEGLTVNSGFQLEGATPARVAQLKDEIHEAFQDFAERCPVKPGEEAALLDGFDAAAALAETWIHDRPFTYPPEEAEKK
jgi:hypothetical protein